MQTRVQIVAIVVTAGLFVLIFELVRQRKLLERYALLWLLSAVTLFSLAVWRNLLEQVSHAVGIFYPPAALFGIAFGFVLVLLLHFSLVISRLSEQNKRLAQRLGLVEQRVAQLEVARSVDAVGREVAHAQAPASPRASEPT